jgi:hypothetical protein
LVIPRCVLEKLGRGCTVYTAIVVPHIHYTFPTNRKHLNKPPNPDTYCPRTSNPKNNHTETKRRKSATDPPPPPAHKTHVEEEDSITIKTEQHYIQLVRTVKVEREVSVLWCVCGCGRAGVLLGGRAHLCCTLHLVTHTLFVRAYHNFLFSASESEGCSCVIRCVWLLCVSKLLLISFFTALTNSCHHAWGSQYLCCFSFYYVYLPYFQPLSSIFSWGILLFSIEHVNIKMISQYLQISFLLKSLCPSNRAVSKLKFCKIAYWKYILLK